MSARIFDGSLSDLSHFATGHASGMLAAARTGRAPATIPRQRETFCDKFDGLWVNVLFKAHLPA